MSQEPTGPIRTLLSKVMAGTEHLARLRTYMYGWLDGLRNANHTGGLPTSSEVKGFEATERPLIDGYCQQIIEGEIGTMESRQLAFIQRWNSEGDLANRAGTPNTAVATYLDDQRAMAFQFNEAIMTGSSVRTAMTAGASGTTTGR